MVKINLRTIGLSKKLEKQFYGPYIIEDRLTSNDNLYLLKDLCGLVAGPFNVSKLHPVPKESPVMQLKPENFKVLQNKYLSIKKKELDKLDADIKDIIACSELPQLRKSVEAELTPASLTSAADPSPSVQIKTFPTLFEKPPTNPSNKSTTCEEPVHVQAPVLSSEESVSEKLSLEISKEEEIEEKQIDQSIDEDFCNQNKTAQYKTDDFLSDTEDDDASEFGISPEKNIIRTGILKKPINRTGIQKKPTKLSRSY